jgi:hypothetical protein
MTHKNIFKSGISFLTNKQQSDGHFAGSEAVFLTSLILSCINSLKNDRRLDRIKNRAVNFLLKQKSEHWSFNYWKKGSPEIKTRPYPDDLDDTFCSLAALYQSNKTVFDGAALAKIVTILTATEKKEGGPYYTWITLPDVDNVWKDIDIAVNSNVAYFLALQDIFLPNMREFLFNGIKQKKFNSKYYLTIFPIIYFLSRYLNLDKKTPIKLKLDLQKFILSKQRVDGSWGNSLDTALAVSSLLRLGTLPASISKSVQFLENEGQKDRWSASTFYRDLVVGKKQYYFGSKALTTAFCLEALSLFDAHTVNIPSQELKIDSKAQAIYDQAVKQAKKRFVKLGTDLRIVAIRMLEKTIKGDKDKQIVLMPYYFNLSLGKRGKKIGRDFLISLGLANIYGWIAYRIYDDFLDDEGKPLQLSVANVCLRELAAIYSGIIPDKFQEVMDTLDNANTWEIAHSRFDPKHYPPGGIPDYGDLSQLSNKSLGHALGPIAILTKLGYGANSPEMKNFLIFFRHYIIARQLNDDAHDWEEDLARGQINAVGAKILTKTKVKSKMQEVFWLEVFDDAAATILTHVGQARSAFPAMESLLVPIEKSIQKGRVERKESLAFIKTYSK